MGFTTQREDAKPRGPIEPGHHICMLTRAEIATSRSNNEMINCRWLIIGPDDPDNGRSFFGRYMLVDESWGYGKLARACQDAWPRIYGEDEKEGGLSPHDQASVCDVMLGMVIKYETKNEPGTYYDDQGVERETTRTEPTWSKKLSALEIEDLQRVYGTHGRPALPDDAYTDRNGNPLRGRNGLPVRSRGESDPGGFDDGFADDDIPF